MPLAPPFRRLARSRRGMGALQPILLLAAALFVLLALKQLVRSDAAPAAATGIDRAFNGGPAPAGSAAPPPTAMPAATVPPGVTTGPAAEAARRLDAIREEVDLSRAASYIAYGRPTDPEKLKTFEAYMAQLQERYDVQFITVPEVGYAAAILRPKFPGDKAILAIAGTDDWKDVVADAGQLLPGTTAGQAVGEVAAGALEGSIASIVAATGQYAGGTFAHGQYNGSLVLADALVKLYGRDNVMAVGHSLGGGQADYVAAMLGLRAVGFNSAPLGPDNLENIRRYGVPGAEANITNINAAGELVSTYSPGQQVGEAITVEGRNHGFFSIVKNHLLDNIDTDHPLRYQPARSIPR